MAGGKSQGGGSFLFQIIERCRMKVIVSIPILSLGLLMSISVGVSYASQGTCKDTWETKCNALPQCGAPGDASTACVITISSKGTKATATQSGSPSPSPRICIRAGTTVKWVEGLDNAYFTVAFGSSHPFSNTQIFQGVSNSPATDDVPTGAGKQGCY